MQCYLYVRTTLYKYLCGCIIHLDYYGHCAKKPLHILKFTGQLSDL